MSDEKQGLGMLNPFYKIIFKRDLKNSQKSNYAWRRNATVLKVK